MVNSLRSLCEKKRGIEKKRLNERPIAKRKIAAIRAIVVAAQAKGRTNAL
jgi:hypothetical protein